MFGGKARVTCFSKMMTDQNLFKKQGLPKS